MGKCLFFSLLTIMVVSEMKSVKKIISRQRYLVRCVTDTFSPIYFFHNDMKKTLSFLFLLPTLTAISLAQAPKFEWLRPIAAGAGADDIGAEPYDFKTDKAGNTYLYGSFLSKKLDFGSGVKLDNPNEEERFFLAKIKPDGTPAWATAITATEFDYNNYASGLAVDDIGNVFISGTLEADVLDFGNNVVLNRSCADCTEIFVARYNSSGVPQWAKAITGSDGKKQAAGKIALSGNSLYLTGDCQGPIVNFGPGFQFTNLLNEGFFLEKMSATDGTPEWVKFLAPNSGYSEGYQVKIAPSGDVWVVGLYFGDAADLGNNIRLEAFSDIFKDNYFLARYSPAGIPMEAVNIHSSGYVDILDIAVDPTLGGVYLACDFSDSLRTGNTHLAYQSSDYAGGLLYYFGGAVSSVLQVPYNGDGFGITGVAAAADGDFYLSGLYNDEELTVGDTTLGNAGGFDSYLMRGNVGGGRKWIRTVGGLGNEVIIGAYYGQALDLDAKGNLYASGAYIGGMQIDGTVKLGSGLLLGKLKQETSTAQEPTLVELDFGLVPNPASSTFQVVLGEKFTDFHTLVLHDAHGREVLRQVITGPTVQVEQSLVSGLYTVSVVGEGQVARKKLVRI